MHEVDEHVDADVRALTDRAQSFFNEERYLDAIAVCKEVIEQFGDGRQPLVRERVAYAVLLEGLSLGKLGRDEAAIGVYDELQARYGDSGDASISVHLAWALNNKAFRLKELGRREQAIAAYDELIARFEDAHEPEIRRRVSWALWNKASLLNGLWRSGEAEAVYMALIGRRDDGLSVELDRNIARCMGEQAWRLGQVGQDKEVVQLCTDLIERFGNASDTWIRHTVLGALRLQAKALSNIEQPARALDAYDQITARFVGASDVDLLDEVVLALIDKAVLLYELGNADDAISTYDEALSRLKGPSTPFLFDRTTMVLVSKGDVLRRLRRFEEAIVVYDSAAESYRRARTGDRAGNALWAAVLALFQKVDLLCSVDRSEDAAQVQAQLISVLGDVARAACDEWHGRRISEAQLAATFTETFADGDCWRCFNPAGDTPPSDVSLARARELYRITEPWAVADEGQMGLAAQSAAGMLRDIADGYAMLTQASTPAQFRSLPLPERAESRRWALIRRFGIDDWLAELGYPLRLEAPSMEMQDDEFEDPMDGLAPSRVNVSPVAFLRFFLTSAFEYELLTAICDSPTGRSAVMNDYLKQYATSRIADARRWVRRVTPDWPNMAGGAAGALLIAQGFFLASAGDVNSSMCLFPPRRVLVERLRDSETYRWLLEHDVVLPGWLKDSDGYDPV